MSSGVSISIPVQLRAHGLEPGKMYAGTYQLTPEEPDGFGARVWSIAPQMALPDGTWGYDFPFTEPGDVKFWLRQPGTQWNSPPAVGPDGTELITAYVYGG